VDDVAIQARDLGRVYRVGPAEVNALRSVDLAVRRGEIVAGGGVSGSGKSTLLHLIGGLDTPTSGEVHVEERSLHSMNSYERTLYRRRVVGFVFQAFQFSSAAGSRGLWRSA
jgi:ABC-type lipoprotein export system ATPase subunit